MYTYIYIYIYIYIDLVSLCLLSMMSRAPKPKRKSKHLGPGSRFVGFACDNRLAAPAVSPKPGSLNRGIIKFRHLSEFSTYRPDLALRRRI